MIYLINVINENSHRYVIQFLRECARLFDIYIPGTTFTVKSAILSVFVFTIMLSIFRKIIGHTSLEDSSGNGKGTHIRGFK